MDSSALLSASFASALLVSGTVTFLLIPEANKRGDNIKHYFKWDSQLMHNGNVLLMFTDTILSGYYLQLKQVYYPVIFGCLYVLFSAYNARKSGIYFYDFIDPRLNGSHIIHMVLLGVLSCMFFLVLLLQEVRSFSQNGYLFADSGNLLFSYNIQEPLREGRLIQKVTQKGLVT